MSFRRHVEIQSIDANAPLPMPPPPVVPVLSSRRARRAATARARAAARSEGAVGKAGKADGGEDVSSEEASPWSERRIMAGSWGGCWCLVRVLLLWQCGRGFRRWVCLWVCVYRTGRTQDAWAKMFLNDPWQAQPPRAHARSGHLRILSLSSVGSRLVIAFLA